jgi:hypothetical protein
LFSQETHKESINFHPPLEIPLRLSGNFGELRSNHFHSGIDIKTQGRSGQKIFAIAEGYVSRIKISPYGYGKALYIHHPDKGLTSVYGHLKEFNDKLATYIKKHQYRKKSFAIQLFPGREEFRVEKGELIGYSGNSGSSNGPHLHFEIRKLSNQHPLNPLHYPFEVIDNIPPKLFNLGIYPQTRESYINGKNEKLILDLASSGNSQYTLLNHNSIHLHGPVGFGIRAFDFLNQSPNWCGIYELKLYIDSTLIYKHTMDEFSFAETRYINSMIDYEEKIKNDLSIQQTFVQPNNKLSVYDFIRNDGIYNFNKNTTHQIHYEVTDNHGNTSVLSFSVQSTSSVKTPVKENRDYTQLMPYNKENAFERNDIKIQFPKNAFYDTVYFNYDQKEIKGKNLYSPLHQIHNIYTPVHKNFTLSIKTMNLPGTLKDKSFIARVEEEDYNYVGGERINGFISARTRKFGEYVVMIDKESPSIKPFVSNSDKISFKIKDELSGIDSYNGYIDGEWALFEYDAKNDLLTYEIDKKRLSDKKVHKLELYISDELNNIATYHDTFTTK